jgi:hypothetical protein
LNNTPLKNKLLYKWILYSSIVFFIFVGIYIYGYSGAFTYMREFIKDGEIQSFSNADFIDTLSIPDKEKEFLEKNKDYHRRVSIVFIPASNYPYWFNWPYKVTLITGLISYPEIDFTRNSVHYNYAVFQKKSQRVIIWGNLILFFILFLISIYIIRHFILLKKYLPCPYSDCNKSIKLITNWTCDYCHNKQGDEISIFRKCKKCDRKLKTIICEHCERELVL